MKALSASTVAILGTFLFAGCAQDGTLTTGTLNPSITGPQTADAPQAKTAAACLTLASEIEALNKHGIAEKVSKAAAKKYKMKSADLAKAAELNKANAEFQSRCSNYPPPANVAETDPAADAQASKKTAAKPPPPIPAPKPIVAAAAPTPAPETTAAATATTKAPVVAAPATTGTAPAIGPMTATGPSAIMTTTAMPTSAPVTTANEGGAQSPPQP
jgi:hypothetical protein